MFILNSKRINIHAAYTTSDGVRYGNLTNPAVRQSLGVVEIPEPTPPADYSEETYYRAEQATAPYVIYTRKSNEQLAQLTKFKLDAKLAVIREVRESILNKLCGIALAAQLAGDTATTSAYVTARQSLLDITAGLADLPLDTIDATVKSRYESVAALCTPALVGALAKALA